MTASDARGLPDGGRITADVCIVGAGPAGITVARELAGTGIQVALLEGGGFERDVRTQELYAGPQSGESYYDLDVTRVRQFGGSSNHWEGYCRPLDAEDFEPSVVRRGGGWPFSRSDIEDQYRAASDLCEIDDDLDYGAVRWADGTGLELLPVSEQLLRNEVLLRSPPTRFGTRYRAELEDGDGIALYHHANVVELVSDGSIVRSARVRQFDGREQLVDADTFVVATGGIEVPRLLLASDATSPGGLGNANDLVGRYFMEHPHLRGMQLITDRAGSVAFYTDEPEISGQRLRGIMTLPFELREEGGIGNAAVLLYEASPRPEDQHDHAAAVRTLMAGATGRQFTEDLRLHIITEQIPNAGSRVFLAETTDELGMRRGSLQWELHPSDRETLRRTVDTASRAFAELDMGRISSPFHGGDAMYSLAGGHHHMGTARMHEDARQGVVDADCKVHGVDNLYVASSAVFPTGGFANPTLTIVALAIRLGEHLRGGV
jgi:choline dehydrogenase-like flavoprotein